MTNSDGHKMDISDDSHLLDFPFISFYELFAGGFYLWGDYIDGDFLKCRIQYCFWSI